MGRPLNKRNFGTSVETAEIKIQFYDGATVQNGWIVKQLGSKKFRCTDGTTTVDCFLVDKLGSALADNEMSITVKDDAGTVKQAVKITGRKVTIDTGESVAWNFSTSTTDGAVEMEESGGTHPVDGVVANVNTTANTLRYHIESLGDTVWTGFGGVYTTDTAAAFTIGLEYRIQTVGDSDFTAMGATSNTVDELFIATEDNAGGTSGILAEADFTATASGSGTGTVIEITADTDHGAGR